MKEEFIEWIFFDIGGVLLDDAEAENRRIDLLHDISIKYSPSLTRDDVIAVIPEASGKIGSLNTNIIELLLKNEADKNNALLDIKSRWKEIGYSEHRFIRPDAKIVLSELSKNYKLGMMANQPQDVKMKLEEAGLLQYFTHSNVSDDYGFHKPDPGLFKAVFKDTKANPKRSAMIDDNAERGLLPAKKFGMYTVWYRTGEESEKKSVDAIINSLDDLLKIF